MFSGYNSISSIYDNVNAEIDYSAWADFIEELFKKYLNDKPELILDLACGTGSMTFELYSRGYDMIGADASEDMLSIAYEKAYDKEISNILFIKQDIRDFELYGTVGAVTCCLDSINYLTGDGDIDKCFANVHNYLDPDGLFIFDVNTPYKFKNVYGNNCYVFEDNDVDGNATFCAWQNEYDEKTKLCNFYLSVFTEQNGKYTRCDETQTERCYPEEKIRYHLEKNNFEVLGFFGDYKMNVPDDTCERWYIAARAKK